MALIDKKLLKFLLVGVANTLVGAGLMFLLYNCFGVSYWISSVCNYVVGGILSFFLNKYFTFQNKQKGFKQILLFILNLAVCYFLAYFVAKKVIYFVFSEFSEKTKGNIALVVGMCLYTALNYFGQRLIVFRSAEKVPDDSKDEKMKKTPPKKLSKILLVVCGIVGLCSLMLYVPSIRELIIKFGEKCLGKEFTRVDFINETIVDLENIFLILIFTFIFIFLYRSWDRFKNVIENHKTEFWVLFGIFILSSLLLFMPGITIGHDTLFHLMRIEGIADELSRGHFPVRLQQLWLDGYGYPVSIYYGDVFLYIPALLHLFGLSLTRAYKFYVLAVNAATTVVSYVCFKRIFKNKWVGLLTSLVYTTAPYRLVDIFVRSAVGEYSALLFFPVVALAFYKIYYDGEHKIFKTAVLFALGMSGLILTHVLSTEMVVFILVLACLIFWKKTFSKKTMLTILLSALLTLLVCAFFIVPFIDYYVNVPVNVSDMQSQYIQLGGVYFSQLFAFFQNPFGQNSDVAGGRMLFSPGLPLMVGFVLSFIYLFAQKKDKKLLFLIVLSCVTIIFSSNIFPWDIISLTKIGRIFSQIQFPWRWLGVSMILMTLLLGRILVLNNIVIEKSAIKSRIICVGVVLMVLLQTVPFISQYIDGDSGYLQNYSAENYTAFGSDQTMSGEYIRLGTNKADLSGEINPSGVEISNVMRDGNSFSFYASTTDAGFVDLPVFNYKGYKATMPDGKKLSICDGENNVVRVLFPQGFDSNVLVKFEEPLVWKLATIISFVSVIVILVLLIFEKRRRCL